MVYFLMENLFLLLLQKTSKQKKAAARAVTHSPEEEVRLFMTSSFRGDEVTSAASKPFLPGGGGGPGSFPSAQKEFVFVFFLPTMASDVNAEGVPAVFFAAAAPVLGQEAPGLPFRLLPGGGGAGLGVVLVVLVEIAVLHHAEAGGDAEVLTAAFVLLDGLVQRPQLAQQGHVLLTQAHLETDSTEVSAGHVCDH